MNSKQTMMTATFLVLLTIVVAAMEPVKIGNPHDFRPGPPIPSCNADFHQGPPDDDISGCKESPSRSLVN